MSDALFSALMNNSFATYRPSRASDGQGGWGRAYTPMGTVSGRIRPATSTEREVALQEQRHITHVLYIEPGTDLQRGDLVIYSGSESDRELSVEVQGVREPSLAGHHLELDCLEVQKEPEVEEGS